MELILKISYIETKLSKIMEKLDKNYNESMMRYSNHTDSNMISFVVRGLE